MTQLHDSAKRMRVRFDQWIVRAGSVLKEIAVWSKTQGWTVKRTREKIQDRVLGSFEVPCLEITLPGGQLQVQPVSLHLLDGEGRVDIKAFPTLNGVCLLPRKDGWEIMTDSGVPLRAPWEAQTFVQLAKDLLS